MDTFVLLIPQSKYEVTAPNRFKPAFNPINPNSSFERKRFVEEHGQYRKFIQNVSVEYKKAGVIYPNLSIDESLNAGKYACNLKISFSNPKLLWGHSYDEVTNGDKMKIIELLSLRLKTMGIKVSEESLMEATVQTLHYCKNIMFPNLDDARTFLERLNKTSLGKRFENNVKTYSYDGSSVRFHTNVFEIIFYLKYADVLQPGTRSVDRHKTLQEIQQAKKYKKTGKIPPVVRMEIRFMGTRSINSHLKNALNIDHMYWSFNDVFNTEKGNKVLSYYWEKIIENRANYFVLSKTSNADVCRKVQAELTGEKSDKVNEALGLFLQLKELGVKAVKEHILSRHAPATYKRKMEEFITFLNKFVDEDDTLIKIVTNALEGKSEVKEDEGGEQLEIRI